MARPVLHLGGVAELERDKKDRIDLLVYVLWVAVLLVLLRYL